MVRIIYGVLLFLALPLSADAALLGTASETIIPSIGPPVPHEAHFGITYGVSTPDPALFDEVLLTSASVGQVLTATAMTDPDFGGIAATMSNGVSNGLNFFATFGSGAASIGNTEQSWFALSTADFSGYSIDTITLTVDEISFETVGNVTNMYFAFTVRVYGTQTLPVATRTWGSIKAMYR